MSLVGRRLVPVLAIAALGSAACGEEVEPTGDAWFGLDCAAGRSACTISPGWEPVAHLDEAFALAAEAAGVDRELISLAHVLFAGQETRAPADLDAALFSWIYLMWTGDVFGGTQITIDVNGGSISVERELDLYEHVLISRAQLEASVLLSFGEIFATFASMSDSFPVDGGQLKDHTYLGTAGDPAFCLFGDGRELCLDAATGAVRDHP